MRVCLATAAVTSELSWAVAKVLTKGTIGPTRASGIGYCLASAAMSAAGGRATRGGGGWRMISSIFAAACCSFATSVFWRLGSSSLWLAVMAAAARAKESAAERS